MSAAAWLGGINLDLRDAKLAPEGADVELEAVMGGIKLTVPAEWRVEVEKDVSAGGIDAHVTPSEELPAGAPLLSVVARARMGGVLVTNGRDEAEREGVPETSLRLTALSGAPRRAPPPPPPPAPGSRSPSAAPPPCRSRSARAGRASAGGNGRS